MSIFNNNQIEIDAMQIMDSIGQDIADSLKGQTDEQNNSALFGLGSIWTEENPHFKTGENNELIRDLKLKKYLQCEM